LEVLTLELSTWGSGVKSGVDGEQSRALHPGGPWCAAYLIFEDLAHEEHKKRRMFRNAKAGGEQGFGNSVSVIPGIFKFKFKDGGGDGALKQHRKTRNADAEAHRKERRSINFGGV
jgi:hypothetical protein